MIEKLKEFEEIKASTVDIAKEDKQEEDLLERNPGLQGSNERDPRFQIYWLTTTKYVYYFGHGKNTGDRGRKIFVLNT